MKEKKITLTETAVRFMAGIRTVTEFQELVSVMLSHMEGKDIEMKSMSVKNVMKQVSVEEAKASMRHAEYERNKVKAKPVQQARQAQQPTPSVRPYTAVKYPTTPEEVQGIAASACKRMTREDAEMYLAKRQSLGWRNNNGQLIQNVGADIRMWALNSDNQRRERQAQTQRDVTKHVSGDYTEVF